MRKKQHIGDPINTKSPALGMTRTGLEERTAIDDGQSVFLSLRQSTL